MRIHFDLMSPSFLSWDNGRPVGASIRNGYKRVRCCGKWLNHHVLIWEHFNGPIPEGMEIDHIDRNRGNNAPSNLRLVTRSQNSRNKAIHKNNKSGIKECTGINIENTGMVSVRKMVKHSEHPVATQRNRRLCYLLNLERK